MSKTLDAVFRILPIILLGAIAFLEWMKKIGLATFPELLIEGDHTMEGGMKAIFYGLSICTRVSCCS